MKTFANVLGVTLAGAGSELGGRLVREASLPGMNEYIRVKDYRTQQLLKMKNVEVFLESKLPAKDVFDFGADHMAIATGSYWRKDRFHSERYVSASSGTVIKRIFTPDEIMDGKLPGGPTLVYNEDGYNMGGIIANRLKAAGLEVMLATPDEVVSSWAGKTSERWKVHTYLMRLGIDIKLAHELMHFDSTEAALACIFTGEKKILPCTDLVMVTQRQPNDALYHECLSLMDAQVEKST